MKRLDADKEKLGEVPERVAGLRGHRDGDIPALPPVDRVRGSDSEEKLCSFGLVFKLWALRGVLRGLWEPRTPMPWPAQPLPLGWAPHRTSCPPTAGLGAVSVSFFLLFGKAILKNWNSTLRTSWHDAHSSIRPPLQPVSPQADQARAVVLTPRPWSPQHLRPGRYGMASPPTT